MQFVPRHFALLIGLLAGAVLITACGGDAETEPSATQALPSPTAQTGSPEAPTPTSEPEPTPEPEGPDWDERAPLLFPNSEIAVAEMDGRIYAIGGYPQSRIVTDVVQVYTAETDTWEAPLRLPVALHHAMAATVDGRLYVIGGETAGSGNTQGDIPAGGPGFVSSVYEYDPATGVWSERAPMPTARSGGATAVVDGKIYVAGGRPPHGADFAVYDPEADAWTVLPELPTQRNHLAAAAIDGLVYVAGGRFGGGVGSEMTDALEVYDPAREVWESRAPLLRPRAGLNGIAARGCLYAFGGEGNDADPRGMFEDMDVYNPATDTWTALEPIPTPVHGVAGAAYLDGWIHLPGGGVARGGSSGSALHQVFRAVVACE